MWTGVIKVAKRNHLCDLFYHFSPHTIKTMSESMHRKRIGDYLVEKGLIDPESIQPILKYCEEKKMKFGEAAIELGLLSQDDLKIALSYPYKKELLIRLDVHFFPVETRSLLSTKEVIEWGILPLGFKHKRGLFRTKKILNIVCVGSEKQEERKKFIDQKLKELNLEEVQYFFALPHEFSSIVQRYYPYEGLTDFVVHSNLRKFIHLERRKS